MRIYVVRSGDTVSSIARLTGAAESEILYINQISYPYNLAVGQALLLPETGEIPEVGELPETEEMPAAVELPETEEMPAAVELPETGQLQESGQLPETNGTEISGEVRIPAFTGGYAYPFIDRTVLEETLPYLTSLYVFSYGFTETGELIPPWADDTPMIEAARAAGVKPILTLTPMDSEGRFSSQRITSLLAAPEAVANLTENLAEVSLQKGFEGVDIDFEYIPVSDRDSFTGFVAELTTALNSRGLTVSVALAPKTSDDQQGLLYEGKDYAGLGAAADSVLLMTYEWGYTYGPPMAVAPLNQVRRVVEYAVTRIPADKIDLGIPNYGYDWTLPFEEGISMARTLGNVEAVRQAVEKGAEILFDETAQSPFYSYTENGEVHEVWFEDVRSMQAKFDLIREFGLRGFGCWQLMRLFRASWLLAEENFMIERDSDSADSEEAE